MVRELTRVKSEEAIVKTIPLAWLQKDHGTLGGEPNVVSQNKFFLEYILQYRHGEVCMQGWHKLIQHKDVCMMSG